MIERGAGVDAVSIPRLKDALARGGEAFMHRAFKGAEIAYALRHRDSAPHFAGMFAAKEAASKALGTDSFHFLTLEVVHDESGKPSVTQSGAKLPVSISI